nr:unnamed protein product [Digitaria exilis]
MSRYRLVHAVINTRTKSTTRRHALVSIPIFILQPPTHGHRHPRSSSFPPLLTATLAAPPFLPSSPPAPARARRSRTTRPFLRVACAYALQEGQSRRFHRLPCGLDLEVIAQPTPAPGERPPLVFVHGSFHAAWCWSEHWLPFFSRAGFPCYALSLRAQGESSVPQEAVAGTLEVQNFFIQSSLVLSFGLVWRYLLTKPVAAIKVTLSLAAKAYANSLSLCKETFFSPQMDDELVLRILKGFLKPQDSTECSQYVWKV